LARTGCIGRKDHREIETDDGGELRDAGLEKNSILDWDVELDAIRRDSHRAVTFGRKVHDEIDCRWESVLVG
jgi:hypothetical protein